MCSYSVAEGTRVRLIAEPAEGASFAGWGGACGGTSACELTVSAARRVVASFSDVPCTRDGLCREAAGQGRRDIHGISGSGPGNIWMVGGGGSLFHHDGSIYTALELTGITEDLLGVWVAGPSDLWVVGSGGLIVQQEGEVWYLHAGITSATLTAVGGSAPDDVWACAPSARGLLHWDGSDWFAVRDQHDDGDEGSVDAIDFRSSALWVGARDNVYFAGKAGSLRRWDGRTLGIIGAPEPGVDYAAVWGSGPSDIWFAGAGGLLGRSDGKGVVPQRSEGAADLLGLWGSGPGDVWAVGKGGAVLRYDGASWRTMESGTQATLRSVWGFAPDGVYVVGDGGTILRYHPGRE